MLFSDNKIIEGVDVLKALTDGYVIEALISSNNNPCRRYWVEHNQVYRSPSPYVVRQTVSDNTKGFYIPSKALVLGKVSKLLKRRLEDERH